MTILEVVLSDVGKLTKAQIHKGEVQLIVTDETGQKIFVPLDPLNRHYMEVKTWFDQQKVKPFKWPNTD